ncbi:QRFP-like peptide receptor [Tachypleus tridentatus]|uniref:QRFP-like peptide receptor n=1 Tax=Tachypleus tridentatus TaxID=6853 RepID=UPI003FD65082
MDDLENGLGLNNNESASDENNSSTNPTPFYDYDPNESFSMYFLDDLIPTTIVYGLTLIVGLTGNILIMYTVVRFRRMRTISNIFLASLASADLLLILVCVPVKYVKLFSYSWTLGVVCCKLVYYIQNVSSICSVLTLTAMSVERYYAIIHPVRSRYMCTTGQARRIIIAIWILSLVFAVPIVFVQIHLEVGVRIQAYWCVRDWQSPIMWRSYEVYMLFLILVVPSGVMCYTYTRICHQLWIVVKERADMTLGNVGCSMEISIRTKNHPMSSSTIAKPRSTIHRIDDDNAQVKQVIKMLVAVVQVPVCNIIPCPVLLTGRRFKTILWLHNPMLLTILSTNVLTAFGYLHHLNYGYLKPLRTAFHLLSYFNSCVNPCVYGFMSQNFRSSFKSALRMCMCAGKKQRIRGHSSLSRTRTTSISYGRSTAVVNDGF